MAETCDALDAVQHGEDVDVYGRCGRELVPDPEGPCAFVGYINPDEPRARCRVPVGSHWRMELHHAYVAPLVCPVHGSTQETERARQ